MTALEDMCDSVLDHIDELNIAPLHIGQWLPHRTSELLTESRHSPDENDGITHARHQRNDRVFGSHSPETVSYAEEDSHGWDDLDDFPELFLPNLPEHDEACDAEGWARDGREGRSASILTTSLDLEDRIAKLSQKFCERSFQPISELSAVPRACAPGRPSHADLDVLSQIY
jgi:hypothetical protein